MTNKTVLSFVEYIKRQLELILGPDNMWFAGEKLHRTPTPDEAAKHFVDHGGAKHFSEIYTCEEKNGDPPDLQRS